jgi:site-specific DNA-methyltransferase (adenine-specific)
MNIEKAINKKEGVSFDTKPAEGVGFMNAEGEGGYNVTMNQMVQTGESTDNAKQWQGWGTALKPANEPICVARKPISEKTIADNVLKWGTGAINIEGCRVGTDTIVTNGVGSEWQYKGRNGIEQQKQEPHEGRFPANIILDEEAGMALDEQSGPTSQGHWPKGKTKGFGEFGGGEATYEGVGPKDKNKDKGGASRFFYCAKVSKKERNEGLDGFEEKDKVKNTHPTVKPINLMAYLCRLITLPQGLVLDPFMGSGSTGRAAIQEGFRFAGMEMDKDYFEIAQKRVEYSYKKTYENGND